jgi:hypothetical protein
MARMCPDVPPSDLEHASEEPVYVALRDQLGNDYTVLHSYPWLRPWRDEALLEGEADFVVIHPQRGILVLEVKGGDVRLDGTRWVRDTSNGPRPIQDPFTQARRNMHALLDIIGERSGKRLRKDDITHGYAVVFPHFDYEGLPPPSADKAIVISRKNCLEMAQAIEVAYNAWTTVTKPLTPAQYMMLLNDCLMPKFRLFRPVGPDISTTADRLLELTETQAHVFEGMYVQDRVLVEGVAGSGKTFLALNRALSFARLGKQVLFVCFNKELAAWLRAQVDEDSTTSSFRALLTIRNFHALAADLAKEAGMAFEPSGGGPKSEAFWNDEVPDLMEQAVLSLEGEGRAKHFDAIVVDEAQDFCLGWWYALTQALLSKPDGPLYAFLDPNQSLRGEVQWPEIKFDARFKLTTNCRNTRRIAAASASVLTLTPHTFPRAPVGGALRMLRPDSTRQQKGLVLQTLRSLLHRESVAPRQIALIGPAAKENGSLFDINDVDGTALVTSTLAWRAGEGVLVTTARSFKGLEADVVVLYDLGGFGPLFKREDLYVSCTRAKALLVAIVHGDQCREVITVAQTASEAEN